VAFVDRWQHDESLWDWYQREIRTAADYDFGILPTSPLAPLASLYRGRMLFWVTNEYGNIIGYHEPRRKLLDKAVAEFRLAAAAFPENRIIRMYLGEAIPCEKQYPGVEGAPQWAVYQRENLERLTDIVEWWIDNRLAEDGQYGGAWDDDCEMWRSWVPVMIAFEHPKITRAQAFFSNALLSQKYMQGGYTNHVYDVEHTAEDSSDALTPMLLLEPDSENWRGRALRLAELMETLWTGVNERGHLQFKSTYFSATEVDASPKHACDTVYHPRAVEPALILWQRTRDPRLGKLFAAWMDTWVDAAARAERGKPAGIIPSAIHWPDGAIGGLGSSWWDPENHTEDPLYVWPSAMSLMTNTLLLAHHMTQEDAYLEPLRSMAQARLDFLEHPPDDPPAEGSRAWCAARLGGLSSVLGKYRLLTGSREFDALLTRDASPYLAYRLGGGEARLTEALRDTAEALRVNFPGYTSEVRYTDRVLRFPAMFGDNGMFPEAVEAIRQPNTGLLYSTATGGVGAPGYTPLNAVRWITPPRDIAALVTDAGTGRFSATLFHFGEAPRPMEAEFYLLEPGPYALTLKTDNGTAITERFELKGTRMRVRFDLPARQVCYLAVAKA